MKPLKLHRAARGELTEAIGWYDDQRTGLGREFLDAVLDALDRIQRDPGVGANLASAGRRFYRLNRFPYIVFYREFPDRVSIVAVAHERRRPGYWKQRKPE